MMDISRNWISIASYDGIIGAAYFKGGQLSGVTMHVTFRHVEKSIAMVLKCTLVLYIQQESRTLKRF